MEPRDCRWRDISPDYYGRLQQFECAKGKKTFSLGTIRKHSLYYNEWELEVQSRIRSFRKPNPESEWAQICVKPGDAKRDEVIYSFVWFGILNGKYNNAEGMYTIGYIARSLSVDTCHFGDFTLQHALKVLAADQYKSGRDPIIGTRIDPRNEASMSLFERNGFQDMGIDETEPDYHRWIRIGFDTKS